MILAFEVEVVSTFPLILILELFLSNTNFLLSFQHPAWDLGIVEFSFKLELKSLGESFRYIVFGDLWPLLADSPFCKILSDEELFAKQAG